MMECMIRPLIRFSRWRRRCSAVSGGLFATNVSGIPFFSALFAIPIRGAGFRSRALKLREASSSSSSASDDDPSGSVDSSSSEIGEEGRRRRSRNEKKREAKRAVRWGMELAEFSPIQIKRILRVAAPDQQIFDALMLVKKLGRDVREGKRRQFNYIGGLLRDVEPELMDGLIQATKNGNHDMFLHDVAEEDVLEEDDGEEDSTTADFLRRWFDGLINNDVLIAKEVYALQGVEFDRQKLRQLVRKVQQHNTDDDDDDGIAARRSLTRFLRGMANQLRPQFSKPCG